MNSPIFQLPTTFRKLHDIHFGIVHSSVLDAQTQVFKISKKHYRFEIYTTATINALLYQWVAEISNAIDF